MTRKQTSAQLAAQPQACVCPRDGAGYLIDQHDPDCADGLGQDQGDDEPVDAEALIGDLKHLAAQGGDTVKPVAAGTFVAYPMPNGGIHLVAQVTEAAPGSPVRLGEVRRTLPPGLLRAFALAANAGGGMFGLISRLGGRRGR